jgi:Domain of unknown function (DUF397)
VEANKRVWRKSSYSGQGNCVEVAADGHGVAVRDSKDPDGPALALGQHAWKSFVETIKRDA